VDWRAVPGFEGRYEVSDAGMIRRVGLGRGVVPGRIVAVRALPAGYLVSALWAGNRQHSRLVHRLVAAAFHGPCPDGYEVNHKNLDKADNRASNLEYVTRSENLRHRASAGIGRGIDNHQSKLDEDAVRSIRRKHSDGEGYKNLGRTYGVSWEAIRNIIKRRAWEWVE
jgi:hypothetical protein